MRSQLPRPPRGQAMIETSLLLATLVGALAVGGSWLVRAHPRMLRAIEMQIRGDYFALSLPFP